MADLKISELPAALAVAGGEALPFAMAGANGRASANQIAHIAYASRPPVAFMDGDSKGDEPRSALRMAMARYPVDLVFTRTNANVGGSVSGTPATTGLTNATRMASTAALIAALAAVQPVHVHLTIGTNDIAGATGAATTPEALLANVRKYHNSIRAAGASLLFLWAVDPRTGRSIGTGMSSANAIMEVNRLYRAYAAITPDCIFVDSTPYWLDPATTNTGHAPIGGSTNTAGAVTYDGLHGAAFGFYQKSLAIEPFLRKLYRPRQIDSLSSAGLYDATISPRGNMVGAVGRMLALGGTDSTTKNESSSVTGTPPNGFTMTGTLSGTLALTFSLISPIPAIDALAGGNLPASNGVRLAFSGAPTADMGVTLTRSIGSGLSIANGDYVTAEASMVMNALTGFHGIRAGSGITGLGNLALFGSNLLTNASDRLPALNGLHIIHEPGGVPTSMSSTGTTFSLAFFIKAGQAVSGSVDLIALDFRKTIALPVAAA